MPFLIFGENMADFMSIVSSNCQHQKHQVLYDFLKIHFYLKMPSASKLDTALKFRIKVYT